MYVYGSPKLSTAWPFSDTKLLSSTCSVRNLVVSSSAVSSKYSTGTAGTVALERPCTLSSAQAGLLHGLCLRVSWINH